jgi:hypothetical protein
MTGGDKLGVIRICGDHDYRKSVAVGSERTEKRDTTELLVDVHNGGIERVTQVTRNQDDGRCAGPVLPGRRLDFPWRDDVCSPEGRKPLRISLLISPGARGSTGALHETPSD